MLCKVRLKNVTFFVKQYSVPEKGDFLSAVKPVICACGAQKILV
jgi:hypothetical protein